MMTEEDQNQDGMRQLAEAKDWAWQFVEGCPENGVDIRIAALAMVSVAVDVLTAAGEHKALSKLLAKGVFEVERHLAKPN